MLFLFESLFNNENERERGEKMMNGKYDRIHSIHFYLFAHHATPKTYFRPGAIPTSENSIFFAPSFRPGISVRRLILSSARFAD